MRGLRRLSTTLLLILAACDGGSEGGGGGGGEADGGGGGEADGGDAGTEPPAAKLHVGPDERVELLAVVQHFTAWASRRHTRFELDYLDEIDQHFGDFSEHAAVARSQQLTDGGFSYDAPPTFVLHHGPLPGFEQLTPYSDYLIRRAGGASALEEFADLLRQFARDSDFETFFAAHLPYYGSIAADVRDAMGDFDYVRLLEGHYGEEKHGYHVVPTPLFHPGGYGPKVDTGEGQEVYNICGPLSVEDGTPSFGDSAVMRGIMLHEFSHSFVNPVTEDNSLAVAASSSLFDPIEAAMTRLAYGNWQTCVNEHLVRVNVARFTGILEGEEAKERVLLDELRRGFVYIRDLDALMATYEAARDRYPTYRDFFPEIVALFDRLAAE